MACRWRNGVFAGRGSEAVGYLIAAPFTIGAAALWMRADIAGQAIEGDREAMRDLYAAAAQRWVEDGLTHHACFVPSYDAELVDAWFRLAFGASSRPGHARDRPPEETVRCRRRDQGRGRLTTTSRRRDSSASWRRR